MPRKVYTKDWPRVPFSLHLSYFGYRHFRAKLVASGGSGNCWEPGRFSARLGMGGRASRSSLHVAGENIGGKNVEEQQALPSVCPASAKPSKVYCLCASAAVVAAMWTKDCPAAAQKL